MTDDKLREAVLEACDRILKAVEAVPYSDKKREGAYAYDDAKDDCCVAVSTEIGKILFELRDSLEERPEGV